MGALMAFRVGQEVVCIDAKGVDALLTKGAHYRIRFISADYVYLVEVPGPSMGFFPSRFRPIVKTDISIFTAMLAPSPKQRVDADAA